jgi:diguanylate cyclase (GGDEF)-like protein
MLNVTNKIFENIADIFVEYISYVNTENKKLNYYEFKEFLAENNEFKNKLKTYLADIDVKPLKILLEFQIQPLKNYFDEKTIAEYETTIKNVKDIDDIVEIVSLLFHSFYYYMDKINNTFIQLWELINELNSKMTLSQKKAINIIDDNIDFMKKENISNTNVIANISSINDVISNNVNISDIKNKILNNIDNALNTIEKNIVDKDKKIKNYEKVYENLKLDLSIYEKQTKAMQNEINKAKKEAITDELTGFYTRKMLELRLEEEFEFLRRNKVEFSLVLIHINELESLKKDKGEYIYKYILAHVSKVIRQCIRKIDIVFKYENDDFLILFPKTNKENAVIVANRINEAIKTTIFSYKDQVIQASINIGGIEVNNIKNKENILDDVNKILNESKEQGKYFMLIR